MGKLKVAGIAVVPVLFLMFFIFFSGGSMETKKMVTENGVNLPAKVLRWKDKVQEECEKNGIPQYVNHILSIIAVETGGDAEEHPDIMQCSESQGRPRNSIQDPYESIEVGVKYFATMAKGSPNKDIWNIVQAYNYGGGYLSECGENYSFDEAMAFSSKRAYGVKVSYNNPIALELGYNWRYDYGNMFYCALVKQFFTTATSEEGNGEYALPVKNPQVSSGFVSRVNPVTGQQENHKGLDFAQPMGDSIYASKAGVVVIAQYDGAPVSGYGKCIIIDHQDGSWTLYAHQSALLVSVGDKVDQGQEIGKVGSTGQSTGPHLHFEVRHSLYGDQVDPAPLLNITAN